VCLKDGKKMKMLKRHLMTDHDMTPAEYRARWGLGSDYPMAGSITRRSGARSPSRSVLAASPASGGAGRANH
jgi:predicted transcriptional regulator